MPRVKRFNIDATDWFDRLPDSGLIREYYVLAHKKNPSPLVFVGSQTFRRWIKLGLAPPAVVIGGTRSYRVADLRRWLKGEWKSEAV